MRSTPSISFSLSRLSSFPNKIFRFFHLDEDALRHRTDVVAGGDGDGVDSPVAVEVVEREGLERVAVVDVEQLSRFFAVPVVHLKHPASCSCNLMTSTLQHSSKSK